MLRAFFYLIASCHLLTAAFQSPNTFVRQTLHPQPRMPLTVTNMALQDVAASKPFFNSVVGKEKSTTAVEKYFDAWNRREIDEAIAQFSDDAVLEDTQFPSALEGKAAIKRHFLLCKDAFPESVQFVVDEVAVSFCQTKIGFKWHVDNDGQPVPNGRGCSFYNLNSKTGLIDKGFDMIEPSNKSGEINLAVLSAAGKFIEKTGINTVKKEEPSPAIAKPVKSEAGWLDAFLGKKPAADKLTAAEKYFEAWNKRDMEAAVDLFTEDCEYEDTVFPEPFSSKELLKEHLLKCSDAFPPTFGFSVDDIADGGDKLGVKWHVENDGEPLPFTRGCSFYNIDPKTGLIQKGFDEVEPAVFKMGYIKLGLVSLATKLMAEPVRAVPLVLWAAYMYIVFFSNGILPGANALALEQRTWEEVRDLSLNFFLVSPLLKLPFSPTIHPMLEGVFNLLLSWAALFAGFLSDDRPEKPNTLPMLPMVAGMQFLTSAFLLPYLTTRSTEQLPENGQVVYKEDLDTAGRVAGESRVLGPLLGGVGLGSIVWGLIARHADFGDLHERYASFVDLLSIDRVGSSFLVDLAIFALFQGWLVDDDMRRRGVNIKEGGYAGLRNIAKFVPFFGLATYLTLRPSLPSRNES